MATLKWHEHEKKHRGRSAAYQANTGDHVYLVYEDRAGWWIRRCMVRHPYEEAIRGPVTDPESARRLAKEWEAQPTT
jgi:hypothetical protein